MTVHSYSVSAENSGKPLGGWGSAPNPAAGAHSAPLDSLVPNQWGAGLLPHPAVGLRPGFSVLLPPWPSPMKIPRRALVLG